MKNERIVMTEPKRGKGRPKKNSKSKSADPAASATGEANGDTKRPVQTEIPGTERVKIRAIDEASETYVNLRDKMQSAVASFKEAKTKLSDLMHKHSDKIGKNGAGALMYRYDDMLVQLIPKDEQLKVKHVDPEDEALSVGQAPEDSTEGTA